MRKLNGISLKKMKGIFYFSLIINSVYCHSTFSDSTLQIIDTAEVTHTIFLFGDARRLYLNEDLKAFLHDQVDSANSSSTAIFLGDNAEPAGLPDNSDPSRSIAEESLNAQLDLLKEYNGKTIFIPGNHDWNNTWIRKMFFFLKKGGLVRLK